MSSAPAPTVDIPMATTAARIRAEYLESPGLRLTAPQARRFLGLDASTCADALGTLVDNGFLVMTRSGAFVQATAV